MQILKEKFKHYKQVYIFITLLQKSAEVIKVVVNLVVHLAYILIS